MRTPTGAKLLLGLALATLSAQAALVNGGFDLGITLGDTGATCDGTVGFTPGPWNSFGFGCGTGRFNPGTGQYAGGNVPSNDIVAYHNGGAGFWQLAPDTWQTGQTSTFSIMIGQRLDETFAGYSIEMWAGTPLSGTLVVSQTQADIGGVTPAPGQFLPASISYTPTGAETWIGQQISVVFRGGLIGTQTNFDNAELTGAVPEPGTYALVGSALIGLAALRRRRD